ncbi:hypothetical protein VTJ49DRAFT_431 [Mycothermus thermophilus]|uniref:Sulfate transporter protein n=1 Tax=Humicola insolens TaxID=85995 RepID=A0ABR3VF56_HUMIN
MAVFVDLGEDESDIQQQGAQPLRNGNLDAVMAAGIELLSDGNLGLGLPGQRPAANRLDDTNPNSDPDADADADGVPVRENPNRNAMTQALGCYPIIMSVASSIDLNTLDSLSRTCRQIRQSLLQYRKMLLVSTLHCVNEDMPVDPDETLRYRARAGNWYYMQDVARSAYTGKSGRCARDLVAECRRCGVVVCRNCAIKPPAPIVLRDRHRRLCDPCVTAPLGSLVRPPLGPEVRIDSELMERAMCTCDSSGVWLCQPCGRSIRSDDGEYKGIWRWRNQYTVLGGLGTGIGEGDRGVICGRGSGCCAAREREQEMDGDAVDAREAEELHYQQAAAAAAATTTPGGGASTGSSSSASSSLASLPLFAITAPTTTTTNGNTTAGLGTLFDQHQHRTPSPALKPGYDRYEVEGIGGVVKKLHVRMVKVGACVPEWEDERVRGDVLGRELQGRRRSWCGWCQRVIPSRKDYEVDRQKWAGERQEEVKKGG